MRVVSPRRRQLDAETLRAQLDLRWPDAVGDRRATTDERHRLVLVHPQYDGFVTLTVHARADLDAVFVLPDRELDRIVTSHHRTGPLERGQQLPIDLELHPGNVARHGTDGVLRLVDSSGEDVAPPVRLTVATDPGLDCVLAGADDGPFESPEALAAVVDELLDGRGSASRLERRVEALAAGGDDPGWGRRWGWGRRR